MAHRIQNLDNMTVHQVDAIFRRGRGIDRPQTAGAAPRESEDFMSRPMVPAEDFLHPIIPMPPAEVVDDELESVG